MIFEKVKENASTCRFLCMSRVHQAFIVTSYFAAAITASVPQLGNVMSLAGSFVTATVGFLFPSVTHTLLLYNQLSRFTIAANILFFFLDWLFCFLAYIPQLRKWWSRTMTDELINNVFRAIHTCTIWVVPFLVRGVYTALVSLRFRFLFTLGSENMKTYM